MGVGSLCPHIMTVWSVKVCNHSSVRFLHYITFWLMCRNENMPGTNRFVNSKLQMTGSMNFSCLIVTTLKCTHLLLILWISALLIRWFLTVMHLQKTFRVAPRKCTKDIRCCRDFSLWTPLHFNISRMWVSFCDSWSHWKIVWDADGSVHNLGEFLKISEDKVLLNLGMAESLLKYERFGIVLNEEDLLRFFN